MAAQIMTAGLMWELFVEAEAEAAIVWEICRDFFIYFLFAAHPPSSNLSPPFKRKLLSHFSKL